MNITITQPSSNFSSAKFLVNFDAQVVTVVTSGQNSFSVTMDEDQFNGLKAILRPMALAVEEITECDDPSYVVPTGPQGPTGPGE